MSMNTTYMRKIVIILGLILTAVASNARAEDETYINNNLTPNQVQTTKAKVANDQQYVIPNKYRGKYYPNDDVTIGYHGTSQSSQNDTNSLDSNHSYYYYYY